MRPPDEQLPTSIRLEMKFLIPGIVVALKQLQYELWASNKFVQQKALILLCRLYWYILATDVEGKHFSREAHNPTF